MKADVCMNECFNDTYKLAYGWLILITFGGGILRLYHLTLLSQVLECWVWNLDFD